MPDQHGSVPGHALPPPPISFARRRATRTLGGAKGKPADIMISPNADRLPPSIQSAPPIPRAGLNQGGASGRLSGMALPSLPPVLGPGQSTQRITASRVPPTPTRLSISRGPLTAGPSTGMGMGMGTGMGLGAVSHPNLSVTSISGTGRSPPTASVPIATTLVPPTPSALAHPHYASEKSAFLAPFEMFYDALADSKTLKTWLGEQLQKSHALTVALQRQQEHLDELVAAAVERRVAPLQDEIHGLHRRVEELEYALQVQGSGLGGPRTSLAVVTQGQGAHGYSPNMGTIGLKGKAKANGIPLTGPASGSIVQESYTFPPVEQGQPHSAVGRPGHHPEQVRRAISPTQLDRLGEQHAREGESRSFPGSQTGSPVPFDMGRRLSVSAIRLDTRGEAAHASHPHVHPHPHAHRLSVSARDRERETGIGGGRLPPPPSATAPERHQHQLQHQHQHQLQLQHQHPGPHGWNAGRPWSPRSSRTTLLPAPSAAAGERERERERGSRVSSLIQSQSQEKPGLVRRSSGQRMSGEDRDREREGERERERDREQDRERERDREREASPPPRRHVRSPEPMEE